MSTWQFCKGDDDISHEFNAENDATKVTLFDEGGCVIISVAKDAENGWNAAASDYYHQWTSFTEINFMSAKRAVNHIFDNIQHDHEVTDTSDIRTIDGKQYAVCDLCDLPFKNLDAE